MRATGSPPRESRAALREASHFSEWSVDDVVAWLRREHNVSDEVLRSVEENHVTGPLLPELDDAAWVELGMTSALKRAKVRLGVNEILAAPPPPSTAILHRVPIVNVFYDLLFDDVPPQMDAVKSTLDTIALLAALFLTIAMAIPASVDFDEVNAARARFDSLPYSAYTTGDELAQAFVFTSALSTYMLGSALIATVVALVSLVVTEDEVSKSDEVRLRYWGYARWATLWAIATLIAGVVTCFFSFNRLVFIKLPDIALERSGAAGLGSITSTITGFRVIAYGMLLFTLFFTFWLMGMGKTSAHKYMMDQVGQRPKRVSTIRQGSGLKKAWSAESSTDAGAAAAASSQ
mmetsp:Transcript_11691/g.30464  ORF Transcript_11691/g.30464 Transcript_11691/m.30464 type:complete len:348 (+) Transcript_11691:27-1070(+)